jgi:hypothetical protein
VVVLEKMEKIDAEAWHFEGLILRILLLRSSNFEISRSDWMPSSVSIKDNSSVVCIESRNKTITRKSIILLPFTGDIIE